MHWLHNYWMKRIQEVWHPPYLFSVTRLSVSKSPLLVPLPSTQSLKPPPCFQALFSGSRNAQATTPSCFFPKLFFWLPLHALRCRSLLPRQCFQQGLSAEWGVHIRPSHSACMSSGISMLKLWNCRHVPGASFAVILFSEKMFWRNICKEM